MPSDVNLYFDNFDFASTQNYPTNYCWGFYCHPFNYSINNENERKRINDVFALSLSHFEIEI